MKKNSDVTSDAKKHNYRKHCFLPKIPEPCPFSFTGSPRTVPAISNSDSIFCCEKEKVT